MNDAQSTSYQFSNLPLTPAIAQRLILQLFGGSEVARRDQIAKDVLATHLKLGGITPTQTATQTVKKALATLREAGLATNPSVGFWKISKSESATDDETTLDEDETEIEESAQDAPDDSWQAERTIGSGNHAVYLFFLPAYRTVAIEKQQPHWQCKIGMTTTNPLERILSQAATALPERPAIGLVIRTNTPRALEKAIHGILEVRGRKISGLPGSEWFMTNPDEIEAMYLQILETDGNDRLHGGLDPAVTA